MSCKGVLHCVATSLLEAKLLLNAFLQNATIVFRCVLKRVPKKVFSLKVLYHVVSFSLYPWCVARGFKCPQGAPRVHENFFSGFMKVLRPTSEFYGGAVLHVHASWVSSEVSLRAFFTTGWFCESGIPGLVTKASVS